MLTTSLYVADACKARSILDGGLIAIAFFVAYLLILVILQDRKLRKAQKSNPAVEVQQAKALDIAHELEEVMHECDRVLHYESAYLDPALTMYTVGRVSRIQLHAAITQWLKRGIDYRLEENQFWNKKS